MILNIPDDIHPAFLLINQLITPPSPHPTKTASMVVVAGAASF
jgi:hypothetical protein